MKTKTAHDLVGIVAGIGITRQDMDIIRAAERQGGTLEVISLEHPAVRQLISKGLVRSCKLVAGPLGLPIAEPGIKLTDFGKKVFGSDICLT